MTLIGALATMFAPMLAPYLGYGASMAVFLSYLAGDESQWSGIWLVLASCLLTGFVTVCGLVYRDLNRRIAVNENYSKQVNENMIASGEILNKKLDRMFGMMLLQAVQASDGDKSKLLEAIKEMFVQ